MQKQLEGVQQILVKSRRKPVEKTEEGLLLNAEYFTSIYWIRVFLLHDNLGGEWVS